MVAVASLDMDISPRAGSVGLVLQLRCITLLERRAVRCTEARSASAALELDRDRARDHPEVGHDDLHALRLEGDRRLAVDEPLLERQRLRARGRAVAVLVHEAGGLV